MGILSIAGLALLLAIFIFLPLYLAMYYRKEYDRLYSLKKSSEVRLGQIAEHLVPFTKNFKHDPKRAHFLGMPIDYIVFEDDKIIFLEVKTGGSRLSATQQAIKKLIEDKQVVWEELRLEPEKPTVKTKLLEIGHGRDKYGNWIQLGGHTSLHDIKY